ncbi:MAG: glycosyltransferase [Bacteroidales bacterium]|nr:glycosyltransferase [Bacteroidales bacterium]
MSLHKIVIVGPAHPYRGGIATFSERLARQFQAEGKEVEMFTFTLQYPGFLFPGKTQYSDEAAPEGLKITRNISSVNPITWIKAGRQLKKMQPDMVIFAYWMSFMAPCMGTIAAFLRKSRCKCIGLIHNMIPHEPNILDKILPGYFVKKMDAFMALSQSVANDVNRFDKKGKPKMFRPHPIYDHYGALMPREEALQLLKLDSDYRYILFFGFIREYKGLDMLIEAMADQELRKMPIKLIVAGEFYEDENKYLGRVEELGLQDKIIFYKQFISTNEVSRYFSACDIVALPYKTATQSGVTQVAFHFEKPMLVTKVGGLGEIVPHEKIGYVVEPQPAEIATALKDFFLRQRAAEFTANMPEEKQKYAWSNLTTALEDYYRSNS